MTERGKGYCPHEGMSYAKCPVCGSEEFYSYPQSIVIGEEVWTHEFTCAKCGHMVGITVRDWRGKNVQ